MIKPQAVKVQKYSITPFTGDNKDWLIFWNQFVVEDDNSKISEISKFNYLLELVEGKPKGRSFLAYRTLLQPIGGSQKDLRTYLRKGH